MHKQTIIDFKELGLRHLFTKPIKELKTRNLDQVEALLREVEAYQKQGFYAVGYVSYEAAPAFEKKFAVHPAPLMGEYLLYFTIHEKVETLPFPEDYEAVDLPANWKEEVEAPAYQEAIETIHHHIRQGDTYQVNYTVQLSQGLKSDPLATYNRLVVEQKAHYNAFIQHDDASSHAIDGLIPLHLKGPDGYIKNPFPFWKKDADRSTVDTSRSLLRLLDDFHSGDLRCPCNRATRKESSEGLDQVDLRSQATFNGRGHLPNSGVLLNLAETGHMLTSNLRNPVHVIAEEVDDHHVFCSIFWIGF